MNSILITGCNRGLGLGIVKTLINLPKPPKYVIATCRSIEKATELTHLADKHKNIHVFEIDLNDFQKYDNLVNYVSEIVKDDGLNVLFNNAGVAPKSTRIHAVTETELISTFTTNTVVPIMLAKACLPLLKAASASNESAEMGLSRSAIINMSSVLGSIEENKNGGLYAYRTSKTALNAATKSLSIDLKDSKVLCVSLHPGWVRTDMGGSKAPLDIETSCKMMIETLLKFKENHNGGFYQFDGDQLPW